MNATGTILIFVLVLSWAYGRGFIRGRSIVWICTSLLVIGLVLAAFLPTSIAGMPPGFYPPDDLRDHEYRGARIKITNVLIIAGAIVAYALLTAPQYSLRVVTRSLHDNTLTIPYEWRK